MLRKIPHDQSAEKGTIVTEAGTLRLAEYDEVLFDIYSTDFEPEPRTVAVTVGLASEFQALLSGLARDGRDKQGNHMKIWAIKGIRSIDFEQSEPGVTMVFNLEPGYDEADIQLELTGWLADLRLRRQHTEQVIARSAIRL